MPAVLSAIVLPVVTKGTSAFFRLLSATCEGSAGYLGRRTASACLHGLDDRALQDIGLSRFQIEAAVHGLVPLSSQPDRGMMTSATAIERRGHRRTPTLEAASWS